MIDPEPVHATPVDLLAALDHVRDAPREVGTVDLIVRRPAEDRREILDAGELDPAVGLVGDTWIDRGSRRTDDGTSHPDMQLNVMSSRAIAALAADPERWALAGDQLYLDLDISHANLPAGTQLAIGDAIIEVTEQPHTGCAKFSRRFGPDAVRWVNSPDGTQLRLRGLNARVVEAGTVRHGDTVAVRRVRSDPAADIPAADIPTADIPAADITAG
ncbi:MAG: MOSC domain-containing protein [Ilumatobacteraceae bacterium]